MRRLFALTLPAVLAVLAVPAGAAPVTASRVAAVRFAVPLAEGDRLELDVRASAHGSTDVLTLAVAECADTCGQPRVFASALPAGALSVDGQRATARLDAVISGLALRVSWVPDTGTAVVLGGLRGGGSGPDAGFTTYRGDPAVTTVTIGDRSCKGTGSVGDQVDVATSDAGDPSVEPLSRLRLGSSAAPLCGG
jgi:hypothetical protein